MLSCQSPQEAPFVRFLNFDADIEAPLGEFIDSLEKLLSRGSSASRPTSSLLYMKSSIPLRSFFCKVLPPQGQHWVFPLWNNWSPWKAPFMRFFHEVLPPSARQFWSLSWSSSIRFFRLQRASSGALQEGSSTRFFHLQRQHRRSQSPYMHALLAGA